MDELSQDEAKLLLANGAVLIIAGVPIGTQFGIDLCSYEVAEMFRGVKMIPVGPHYVYTAAQGPYRDMSPRVGFMHTFKRQEILVREWDPEKEQLRVRQTSNADDEIRKIKENLLELDRYLAPYDYTAFEKWITLSRYIDEETVIAVMPECGLVTTSVDFESCPDTDRPRGSISATRRMPSSFQTEDDLLPKLKIVQNTALRFTKLPKRCPANATPEQITASHMDSIEAVDTLIQSYRMPERLINEIQFAFILYLCGYSIDGLEHWRRVLSVLANSERAVYKYPRVFAMYLDVLQHQLPELPEELMAATINNSVYKDIRQLIINCTDGGIKKRSDNLVNRLTNTMQWSFDGIYDEDPEDGPVIVEL